MAGRWHLLTASSLLRPSVCRRVIKTQRILPLPQLRRSSINVQPNKLTYRNIYSTCIKTKNQEKEQNTNQDKKRENNHDKTKFKHSSYARWSKYAALIAGSALLYGNLQCYISDNYDPISSSLLMSCHCRRGIDDFDVPYQPLKNNTTITDRTNPYDTKTREFNNWLKAVLMLQTYMDFYVLPIITHAVMELYNRVSTDPLNNSRRLARFTELEKSNRNSELEGWKQRIRDLHRQKFEISTEAQIFRKTDYQQWTESRDMGPRRIAQIYFGIPNKIYNQIAYRGDWIQLCDVQWIQTFATKCKLLEGARFEDIVNIRNKIMHAGGYRLTEDQLDQLMKHFTYNLDSTIQQQDTYMGWKQSILALIKQVRYSEVSLAVKLNTNILTVDLSEYNRGAIHTDFSKSKYPVYPKPLPKEE